MRQHCLTRAGSQGPYSSALFFCLFPTLAIPFASICISVVEKGLFSGVVLTIVFTDAVILAKPFAFSHRIHNNLILCVTTIFQAKILEAIIIELSGAYETKLEFLQNDHVTVSR